tara:strand:+ start:17478 stop:18848 length:1371 start_codon:yes stop_codon:yes gene_type:complete
MDAILRNVVGWLVGKLVLTAQLIPIVTPDLLRKISAWFFYPKTLRQSLISAWANLEKLNATKSIEQKLDLNRFFLPISSNVKIDTIEMCYPANQDSDKYIIYGWGRSDCYEKRLYRLASDALNLNAHIVSFNFRGVGHSSGCPYSEDDMAQDYVAQIKRLVLDKKVKPENIILHGHSLGGGAAILALAKAKENGWHCKIRNDRSFRNLIDVSTSVNFENKAKRFKTTRFFVLLSAMFFLLPLATFSLMTALQAGAIFLATVLSCQIKLTYKIWDMFVPDLLNSAMIGLMQYGRWPMDVAPIFEKFPEEDKSFMVIRQPRREFSKLGLGEKKKHGDKKDKVIWPKYTLYSGLTITKQKIKAIEKRLASIFQSLPAQEALSLPLQEEVLMLQRELKKHENVKVTGGTHGDDPKMLLTRYEHHIAKRHITGQEQWYDFVEPEGGHTEVVAKKYKIFTQI